MAALAAIAVSATALVAAAVSAGARSSAFDAACTGPLVVTNGQDAYPHPPAGSLRYVLDHAHRGETVSFCDSTLVQLVAPLDIVSGEDRVTITGGHIGGDNASAGEGLIRVSADGVKLINDVLSARLSISGADDVLLHGDQFSDSGANAGTSQAVIEVARALRLTLDHVQVSASQEQGLSIQGSSGVVVTNSAFTVGHHSAIVLAKYPLSSALTVRNSTSDGDFELAPTSGEIAGNTITGGPGGRGLFVSVPNDGFLHHYGRLTVSGNTLDGASIDIQRSNLVLSANIVSKGPGIVVSCDPNFAGGTVSLSANRSMGAVVGLAYSCDSRRTSAASKNNESTSNLVSGFRFDASKLTSSHDSATAGAGAGFQLAAGPISLSADVATTNTGAGVSAAAGARASITGGTIQSNGGAGVFEGAGAQVRLQRVLMGGNTGPGIVGSSLAPPVLKYKGHAIFGTTCADCVVEVFTVEAGARAGNLTDGEGAAFVRELRTGAGGRFVDRVSCPVAKTLTFTATRGGATPETSGFSQDVSCAPPLLHVFARITYAGVTCNTITDGTTVTVTDPTATTPVEYYSYFTVPHNCADPAVYAFGDTAWVALNADSENQEKTPDAESPEEDGRELALPNPVFPPDTTLYATHIEVCSTTGSGLQPSGLIYYQALSCPIAQERVDIEVTNHQPGG
jgi:hypothetical protein